ncbi:hypothetical protein AVEN_262617-1 [Araneus ventricosus]|uniref:Uncharacterized protein n=1 Tax=Araneus ventricosus TaxID=182803 RepID=A0A4Y2PKS3_ARAVE|nr:hypothetical protein AVEN_262617-1 [Araneus ventricosus]
MEITGNDNNNSSAHQRLAHTAGETPKTFTLKRSKPVDQKNATVIKRGNAYILDKAVTSHRIFSEKPRSRPNRNIEKRVCIFYHLFVTQSHKISRQVLSRSPSLSTRSSHVPHKGPLRSLHASTLPKLSSQP